MKGLVLLLGIICCLQIGSNDAATVRVSKAVNAKVGDQVALECYGSADSISFYIRNRISWSYVNMHNEVIPITEGFYCTGPTCKNGHYAISHVGLAHEYLFNLTITAVNDADAGYYKCSLLDDNDNVTDSKTVKLTVVRSNDAATVRVSKAVNAKVGDQVALECYGSEDRISFYIRNRISWSYVNMHNEVIPITEGFYCIDWPTCKNGHYAISPVGLAHEYLFNLTITAVNDADAGYYKCSLLDDNDNVTDSKTVKLTVVYK